MREALLCPSAKVRELVGVSGRRGRVRREVGDVSTLKSGNENGGGKKVEMNAMSGWERR